MTLQTTVHPTAPSAYILEAFLAKKHHHTPIQKKNKKNKLFRVYLVHCRVTKIVPLVQRPTLVSYINVPSVIVRSKQSPKSQISLSGIFFEAPCTIKINAIVK